MHCHLHGEVGRQGKQQSNVTLEESAFLELVWLPVSVSEAASAFDHGPYMEFSINIKAHVSYLRASKANLRDINDISTCFPTK